MELPTLLYSLLYYCVMTKAAMLRYGYVIGESHHN